MWGLTKNSNHTKVPTGLTADDQSFDWAISFHEVDFRGITSASDALEHERRVLLCPPVLRDSVATALRTPGLQRRLHVLNATRRNSCGHALTQLKF
eukprot:s2726_g2.t1